METREIVELIKKEYDAALRADFQIGALYKKIQDGTANYAEASRFASCSGKKMGNILSEYLQQGMIDGRVTQKLAADLIPSSLKNNHERVAEVITEVQKVVNRNAGIGLNPKISVFNMDKAEGLVKNVSGVLDFAAYAKEFVDLVENNSLSIVDESIKENAEAQYQAGLSPKIKRIVRGKEPCKWCLNLAGTYDYQSVSDTGNNVFKRHNRCRCQVLFIPVKGSRVQDVHTKGWKNAQRPDEIDARSTQMLIEELTKAATRKKGNS